MTISSSEVARDYFNESGTHQVIGGVISPVNDSYNKPGLISSTHRCAMIKAVLRTSDWIRMSDWECKQEDWTRTRISLQYHQVVPLIRHLVVTGNLTKKKTISSTELRQFVHKRCKWHSKRSCSKLVAG